MKKMSAEDSQTLLSQSTTDQAAEEPGLIPSASLQFDDWDEAGKVDIRLLRCYCETDLASVLRPRTWQDVHHGRPGYRAGWLLTSFMPKVWMGLCVLTPRQYAAAECLLAAEGLEAPFQPIEECPDWTEAACLEGKRLSLARGLHSYMLHLTESEARPLMAMNEALQRFKAKCEESWNDAAPEESNPAADGPQAAPASAEPASDWISKAQSHAWEIIERQKVKDLYPPQLDIANEIAREFRAAGIVGADKKPLSGATIKRHALQGISSEQGKRLSTSTARGK